MMTFRLARLAIILLVVLFLAGCASLGGVSAPERTEARLKERATAYWEARRLGDFHTFFSMESAGLPGGWMTPIMAAKWGREVRLEQVEIKDVRIDGESATLTLSAQVRFLMMANTGMQPFHQVVEDRWVWTHGDWYHFTPEWKPISEIGAPVDEPVKPQSVGKSDAGEPQKKD